MRAGIVLVILAACGGGRAAPRGPSFTAGATVRITDGGQIYDALNTVECLKWPSAAVKKRAGRDAWNGFQPGTGLEGKVVASVRHCEDPVHAVLVEVGEFIVPVTHRGVEKVDETKGEDPLNPVLAEGVYGGEMYGGLIGEEIPPEDWFVEGGVEGGVVGGVLGGVASSFYPGDAVEIVDEGEVFPDINEIDCLTWPDAATKKKGGQKAWGSFSPKNGDTGVVLATSTHCHDGSEVVILDVGGHIVPIRAPGVVVY